MWNDVQGQPLSTSTESDAQSPKKSSPSDTSALDAGSVTSHQSPLLATLNRANATNLAEPLALGVSVIGHAQLQVRERPFRALVNLRGNPRDEVFVQYAEALLGCALPLRANTTTVGPVYRVIWTGPDEWWVQSHDAQASTTAAKLETDLREALADSFAAATDVGSGYTTFEISGPLARVVLSRGCPLDLHARVFAADHCAQSHFFKADVLLTRIEGDLFEMIVRRSFATYVMEILRDAAQPLLADKDMTP